MDGGLPRKSTNTFRGSRPPPSPRTAGEWSVTVDAPRVNSISQPDPPHQPARSPVSRKRWPLSTMAGSLSRPTSSNALKASALSTSAHL